MSKCFSTTKSLTVPDFMRVFDLLSFSTVRSTPTAKQTESGSGADMFSRCSGLATSNSDASRHQFSRYRIFSEHIASNMSTLYFDREPCITLKSTRPKHQPHFSDQFTGAAGHDAELLLSGWLRRDAPIILESRFSIYFPSPSQDCFSHQFSGAVGRDAEFLRPGI